MKGKLNCSGDTGPQVELAETESRYEKPGVLGFGPAEQMLGKVPLAVGCLYLSNSHCPKQLILPKALVAGLFFTGCVTIKCKNCRCAYYTTSVLSTEKVFLPNLRVEVFSYPVFSLSTGYFVFDHLPPARSQWCFIDLSGFCLGYALLNCIWLPVWYWQGPVSTR